MRFLDVWSVLGLENKPRKKEMIVQGWKTQVLYVALWKPMAAFTTCLMILELVLAPEYWYQYKKDSYGTHTHNLRQVTY